MSSLSSVTTPYVGHTVRFHSGHTTAQYYVRAPLGVEPTLDGLFDATELAAGLRLLRVDLKDVRGVNVHGTLEPGLRIALVIGGKSDVSYGDRRLVLDPTQHQAACGSIVSLNRREFFHRQSRRGERERTASLTLSTAWLQSRLGIDFTDHAFFARHLAARTWTPSQQAVTLVEQMLRPPALTPPLWRLYLESRALDVIVEALGCLESQGVSAHDDTTAWQLMRGTSPAASLRERDRMRMCEVRDLLDSVEAESLSLHDIAQRACVSVNTLQRHFRATWGKTVVNYLRDARLMRARVALERDGATVSEAADIAGYTSAANFATAFKRCFDISPGQVRSRR